MGNKFLIVCGGAGAGLLGQRTVLGMAGELQLDAREEIPDHIASADEQSDFVRLDAPAGTAQVLLVNMKGRIRDGAITDGAYKRHTEFLVKYWPGDEPLKAGLARAPALGGGSIRHEENLSELDAKLSTMINEWAKDIGPANPVEVWIVSSACGGTGEGIHRFVGERLVELLTREGEPRVTLNFIRIGQSTYRAVDADRTALNTFFGIAADAAFKLQLPRAYRDSAGQVAVNTNWYYLELPPVGVGPAAVPIRARLVEMAAKAIVYDDLQESLQTITVNDGIGLIRVGFWGSDFEQNMTYYQTLDQLVRELKELIEPDYFSKYVSGRPQPTFEPEEPLKKVLADLRDHDYIIHEMESEGWKFPKYGERIRLKDLERMGKHIEKWKRSIDRMIHPQAIDELQLSFSTLQRVPEEAEMGEAEEADQSLPLSIPAMDASVEPFSKEWFTRIESAQRVKGWCSELLGITIAGIGAEGLLAELDRLARECSKAQHRISLRATTAQRATDLAEYLCDFVETLVKVDHLQELENTATHLLQVQLENPTTVLDYATRQRSTVKAAVEGKEASPIIAAKLSKGLDKLYARSWLAALHTAVQLQQPKPFRSEVLKGAVGLTDVGLVAVLGIRQGAGFAEIKGALRKRMGRMHDEDQEEFEGQWWQAKTPPGILQRIRYRILPELEEQMRAGLGDRDGEIKYLYAEFGLIGLNVLAFEGAMITRQGDMVTTPAYLIRSFVPTVRHYLKDWKNPRFPGEKSNKLAVASAGVGGEPLFKPALEKAGLTLEELEKLAEFYELYSGGEEEQAE